MCDTIIMYGDEIESINPDGTCLCNNTQSEILTWIVQHSPEIGIGETIEIVHTPFGYEVRTTKVRGKHDNL